MAKVIEHALDDPDGPLVPGAWRILSPNESRRLARATEPRLSPPSNTPTRDDKPVLNRDEPAP